MDDPRTDAQLLKASGTDADAFGIFFDRHIDAIGSYLHRRTADHAVAAELASETFAQAFASRRRYRRTSVPASAWLYTIAARQINEFHRTERVSRTYRSRLGVSSPVGTDDFDRVDDLDELRSRLPLLRSALDGLTATSAEAVMLRVGHGWSYAALGDHLGCAPATARVRVSRALAQLERHLSPNPEGTNP